MKAHEFLEIIRHLEHSKYLDEQSIAHATQEAGYHNGSAFDRLLYRAALLDETGEIQSTLEKVYHNFWLARRIWLVASLVGGLVFVWLLASMPFLNFFYVWLLLIIWHTLSLGVWLARHKQHDWLTGIYNRFATYMQQQAAPLAQVAQTLLNSHKHTWRWQISNALHQAWLAFLLGNILAWLSWFMLKDNPFVWQDSLLTNAYVAKLVALLGYLPSLIGLHSPSADALIAHSATDGDFIRLLCAGTLLYAVLPRLLCWFINRQKAQKLLNEHRFKIDTQLYYYEKLSRQLAMQQISPQAIQANRPIIPTPTQAVVPLGRKIVVASLAKEPDDPNWYQFGAGHTVKDFGTINHSDDMQRLLSWIDLTSPLLYLGIPTDIAPTADTLENFLTITQSASAAGGVVIELLGNHQHAIAWKQVLCDNQLSEVRFA